MLPRVHGCQHPGSTDRPMTTQAGAAEARQPDPDDPTRWSDIAAERLAAAPDVPAQTRELAATIGSTQLAGLAALAEIRERWTSERQALTEELASREQFADAARDLALSAADKASAEERAAADGNYSGAQIRVSNGRNDVTRLLSGIRRRLERLPWADFER